MESRNVSLCLVGLWGRRQNNIGPSGAGFIFFGMGRHHHLLVLGMAYNVIGDQGARAAADVLTEVCMLCW